MRLLLWLFTLLIISGCNKRHSNKAQHSFYYWKTTFNKTNETESIIKEKGVDHFYIHFFDVAWSAEQYMAVPVAEITNFKNAIPFTISNYTPVVYITNETFLNTHFRWGDSLANKIGNKIIYISNRIKEANKNNQQTSFDEIQIDCDWTVSSKEEYFYFLVKFKQKFPQTKISVTIRLYPYKYSDSLGVPPVDKGLLMCYNLTDIKNSKTSNSIFEIKDLKQYLVGKSYPLPLDMALPVFGWYAWFSEGQFKGIVYPQEQDLFHDSNYFKKSGKNFTALIDTTIGNNYLQEGDVLRMEFPADSELEEAAELLKTNFPTTSRIALYHWDETLIKRYDKAINSIYKTF